MNDHIVKRWQLPAITGLTLHQLNRLIAAEQFPKPVQLAGRSKGWRSTDLKKWIDELPNYPRANGSDRTPQAKARLTKLWLQLIGTRPTLAAHAWAIAKENRQTHGLWAAFTAEPIFRRNPSSQGIGKLLATQENEVFCSHVLIRDGMIRGSTLWRFMSTDDQAGPSS